MTYRYHQLTAQLREAIIQGRYSVGERLPSIRKLCERYQVSKSTVQQALQSLEAEQLLIAQARIGYFVRAIEHIQTAPASANKGAAAQRASTRFDAPAAATVPALFYDIMQRGAAFDIYPSQNDLASPHLTVLMRNIARAQRQTAQHYAHYYDEPMGNARLREQLLGHYHQQGYWFPQSDICITAGCQHSLFLALATSCQAGDTVAVESPAFYGVLQLLEQLKLQVVEIPSDAVSGLDVSQLEQALQRWPIKACVVTPDFATPSGACMPLAQRQQLLALAQQYQLLLVEDGVYQDLAFSSSLPSLKALDTHDRVILCGSFSKSVSRDLRVGWIVAGQPMAAIVRLKMVTQLAGSGAVQEGIADFIANGDYRRHLQYSKRHLRFHQQQWADLLRQQAAHLLTFEAAQGGLSLWLTLHPSINSLTLYQRCLAEHISLTPGMLFSVKHRFQHHLRFSFLHPVSLQRRRALEQTLEIADELRRKHD